MASEFVILNGKAKWFRLYEGQENKYGKSSVDFYFASPEDRKKFSALRAKNNLREDGEGFFVKLYRDAKQEIKGETLGYCKVVDADNNPLDKKTLIGNGSEIAVKLEHFSWDNDEGTQYGVRVAAVKILKLVKYEKKDDAKTPTKGGEAKREFNDPLPF